MEREVREVRPFCLAAWRSKTDQAMYRAVKVIAQAALKTKDAEHAPE